MLWHNPDNKTNESIYVPSVSDVLTSHEIEMVKSKNGVNGNKYAEAAG